MKNIYIKRHKHFSLCNNYEKFKVWLANGAAKASLWNLTAVMTYSGRFFNSLQLLYQDIFG